MRAADEPATLVLGANDVWTQWMVPLLGRCFSVSISTPDSLAFFMADVARGQPDRLEIGRQLGGKVKLKVQKYV